MRYIILIILTILNITCLGQVTSPSMQGFQSEVKPKNALIAYYHLDETTGNRIDASGRGSPALVPSSAISGTAGLFGNAAAMPGSNINMLSTPNYLASGRYFTAWIRLTALPNNYLRMFIGGGVQFYSNNQLSWDTTHYSVPTVLTLNVWHFVACGDRASDRHTMLTYDGNTYDTGSVNMFAASGIYNQLANAQYSTGAWQVDEYAVYNRPLSTAELTAIYNAGVGMLLK